MNLQPVIEYLQTQNVGTIGVDLFREKMPAAVTNGVLVTSQVPIVINPYSCTRSGSFQIIARAADHDDARAKAIEVSDVLRVSGIEMGNMKFFHLFPRNEPLIYPISDGDLIEASVDIDFSFFEIA